MDLKPLIKAPFSFVSCGQYLKRCGMDSAFIFSCFLCKRSWNLELMGFAVLSLSCFPFAFSYARPFGLSVKCRILLSVGDFLQAVLSWVAWIITFQAKVTPASTSIFFFFLQRTTRFFFFFFKGWTGSVTCYTNHTKYLFLDLYC